MPRGFALVWRVLRARNSDHGVDDEMLSMWQASISRSTRSHKLSPEILGTGLLVKQYIYPGRLYLRDSEHCRTRLFDILWDCTVSSLLSTHFPVKGVKKGAFKRYLALFESSKAFVRGAWVTNDLYLPSALLRSAVEALCFRRQRSASL